MTYNANTGRLQVKLFTVSQFGATTGEITVDVAPNSLNAYPELIVYAKRYFVPTPMRGEYREITQVAHVVAP